MGMMSKDIGIDLGTSNIRIYVKGKGVVLCEPSVVAINKITKEVLAVGSQAKEMLGRTPDNIVAVKPLRGGVIADFSSTKMLVQNLVNSVVPKSLLSRPRILISIPSGITDVEERAVESVSYRAGAKNAYLIEEVMAGAIGARLKVEQPEGNMIVDIGGGTSEMAVLSLGGIVATNSTKIAGEKLDIDIVNYIKNKFNVLIGVSEAEEVKKQIGAATRTMTDEKISIKGRDLITGLPKTIVVTSTDVNIAIYESLSEILRAIKLTLEQTPPELSADIMDTGIILCGGVSQLKNLDRFISEHTGIPVSIAENPSEAVIRGVGSTLENIEILKKIVKTRRR